MTCEKRENNQNKTLQNHTIIKPSKNLMKQATQKECFVFEMRKKCKSNFSTISKKPVLTGN